MKRKYPSSFVANPGRISAEELAKNLIDQNVKLPAAVQATADKGEEASRRLCRLETFRKVTVQRCRLENLA